MNIGNESQKLRRSDRFPVEIAGQYGYVDHTGAMAILPLYESARDFSEGLAWVKTKGGPGYINTLGQESNLQSDYVGFLEESDFLNNTATNYQPSRLSPTIISEK